MGNMYFLKKIKTKLIKNKNISIGKNSIIYPGAQLKTPLGGKIQIGNFCNIHHGVLIYTYGGDISIGDFSTVNPYCVLYGHGNLKIGKGVRIAAHTVVIPSNHNYKDRSRYIYEQGEFSIGIVIENDVWIGANTSILDGVTISQGCIVGAGSVVTKSTEPYGIYAGVPARKIKER